MEYKAEQKKKVIVHNPAIQWLFPFEHTSFFQNT
jgi:hypothetical protein